MCFPYNCGFQNIFLRHEKGPSHSSIILQFADFDVPCIKSGGLYDHGDFVEILEYAKEGYFWIVDPETQKVFSLDLETKNIVLQEKKVQSDGIFEQLWYWDYMYIRNVQLRLINAL